MWTALWSLQWYFVAYLWSAYRANVSRGKLLLSV
jgi:hypothetical protein